MMMKIVSMMREDGGEEVRVEEVCAKTMEGLEGGEVNEEACRSAAEVGRGSVAYKREFEILIW